VRIPIVFVLVDVVRYVFGGPGPVEGGDDAILDDGPRPHASPVPGPGTGTAPSRPLAGLRVLDLGVIVVGAETGRLLADQGAEVIKIESSAFPDGSRQSFARAPISASFGYGHRGKLSLGLDLRAEEGREIFRRLVAVSDVVLSNFKPGTMESLGFSHQELAAINPAIITAESSAFGPEGPWSRRMGYGPLVRASAGLTGLWAYPDRPGSWSDASTIYPDHIAARAEATAVVAALARRRRTGTGARITASQADVILGHLAPALARESLAPGSVRCLGNVGEHDAPRGLYPCAGDDEWVIVDVRGDDDWRRLATVIGTDGLATDPRFATAAARLENRTAVEHEVTAWTGLRTPREVMTALQGAGVPAGAMLRVPDLLTDPHLRARDFLAVQPQPQIDATMWAEARHAHFRSVPDPELRPGPLRFEHTRDVCTRVLGLDPDTIDRLAGSGVLQLPAPVPTAAG
jgi:crotonobetainyl-CoA:carnitine CoA-transferase CaiB-like acyl-CoA transferase